eukprot:229440-Pyramimonas_sp.AAC.2
MQQLFAAQFDIAGRALRAILPPSIVVHWGGRTGGASDALHILTPESGNDGVVAQIMRWKEELRQSRSGAITAEWVTTRVQLPRDELLRHQGLDALPSCSSLSNSEAHGSGGRPTRPPG